MYSALAVFSRNALYKSTFYLLTYLLNTSTDQTRLAVVACPVPCLSAVPSQDFSCDRSSAAVIRAEFYVFKKSTKLRDRLLCILTLLSNDRRSDQCSFVSVTQNFSKD